MNTKVLSAIDSVRRKTRTTWYGDPGFVFSRLWLGLAVFSAAVSAINVTVWPRFMDPKLVASYYMTYNSVIWPTFICLGLAAFFGQEHVGMRSWVKAMLCIAVIGLVTWLIWSPESQAWLEELRRQNR